MAPRGFFTCKSALDTLRREHAGELFPGFSRGYAMLEWRDPAEKAKMLEQITRRYPAFARAWKDLASLLNDDDSKRHAIERGLGDNPSVSRRYSAISRSAIMCVLHAQYHASVFAKRASPPV